VQYFCTSKLLTWLLDERKLLFYHKSIVQSHFVLRTSMSPFAMSFEYVSICDKYKIKIHNVLSVILNVVYGMTAKYVVLSYAVKF